MTNKQEEIFEKIKEYYKNYGAQKTILNFEDDILNLNRPYLSYRFARSIEGANIKVLEQVVLESKDPKWCYNFAKNIKEANVKAHEQIVLESKDPYWCFYFARNVEGANIEALGQVVLESKDSEWYYRFAKEINLFKYSKEEIDTKDIKRLVKTLKDE